MRVVATARWTADEGPLVALRGAPDAARSRFGRMAAHVLGAIDRDRDPDAPWIVATTHGPYHARVSMAKDGEAAAAGFATPDVVHALADALGHRGSIAIVSAGDATTAMAFVEAAAAVAESGAATIVLVDEATPIGSGAPLHDALAVALALRRSAATGWQLCAPQRRRDARCTSAPAALGHHPLWPALGLVDALRRGETGWLSLETTRTREGWAIEISA